MVEGSSQTQLVDALATGITAEQFWSNIAPFGALIATLVVFAFGYRILRKVISGAGKGKAKF